MLVECIKPFRDQVLTGKEYIVLEVAYGFRSKSQNLYVLDETGCPACYDKGLFEISKNDLTGYKLSMDSNGGRLTYHLIKDAKFCNNDVYQFWLSFYEDDNPEALKLIQESVNEIAERYGIEAPIVKR